MLLRISVDWSYSDTSIKLAANFSCMVCLEMQAMVDVEETYLNPVPATVTAVKKKRIRHRKRSDIVQVNIQIVTHFY